MSRPMYANPCERTGAQINILEPSIRAAEAFAAQRIADPNDRARFLDLVRTAMAGSIQKGEPLPSVRLRAPRARVEAAPSKAPNPKREEPTR